MARWIAGWIAAVALTFPAMGKAQGPLAPQNAAAVHAVLNGMQAAWNHHDMHAFVALMTDDVEWVNIVGMRWQGRAQVFLAHDRMHRTTFKERQMRDAESADLRQVAPGVVIATEVISMDGFPSPNGTPTPPSRNMLTLALVRRGGQWLITEGHNTIIDPVAAAHDPGR